MFGRDYLSYASLGSTFGQSWGHVKSILAKLALCWPFVAPILARLGHALALSWPYVGHVLAYVGAVLKVLMAIYVETMRPDLFPLLRLFGASGSWCSLDHCMFGCAAQRGF